MIAFRIRTTHEIHHEAEPRSEETGSASRVAAHSFATVVAPLILIDLVFSLDSIIPAIGMENEVEIMITAVIFAMIVIYVASGPVAAFITEHPTTKMLALAFLLLAGAALVAEGFDFHIPREYIDFAMAFAGAVEACNVLARRNRGVATR